LYICLVLVSKQYWLHQKSLGGHSLEIFKKERKDKMSSHCGSWGVSQCVTQYTFFSKQLNLQMFVAMSHWSGSSPLASATPSILDPHQDFSQLSSCCPVSWRSCSFGSVGPVPSPTPEVHRWGGCWDEPSQSPGSGRGWKLGLSFHLFPHAHTTSPSSPALPRQGAGPALLLLHPQANTMPCPQISTARGQFYCAAKQGAGSILPLVSITFQLGWEFMTTSTLHAGISHDLTWAPAGIIHAVTTSVSLYVQLPCWVWKSIFTCSQIPLLTLTVFALPLLKESLTLERRGVIRMSHIELDILQSLVLCTMTSHRSLYYLPSSCEQRFLWWGMH
jgi:hypothetical protein